MALTVTLRSSDVFGNKRFNIVEIGFDDSYPTDGEPLTARALGMSAVDFALFEPSLGYIFEYSHTAFTLFAYYADYDAVADGPLIQVPNATNLSALTNVRGLVVGS